MEDRIKVLNMLAAGTINVEQANQLLATLEDSEATDNRDSESEIRVRPERPTTAKEPKFGAFTFDQILQMGAVGVDPSFVAKVRKSGLTDISFEQILEMGAVGVEPEFVVRAREAGIPDLTFDQILEMGAVGVDPSFLIKVREAGLTDLSVDQIVEMKAVGVEPEFFSRMREESIKG